VNAVDYAEHCGRLEYHLETLLEVLDHKRLDEWEAIAVRLAREALARIQSAS
jgi:hypothetical protein